MIEEKKFKIIKKDNKFRIEDDRINNKKYIYYKYSITEDDVKTLFNQLQNYKLQIMTEAELKEHRLFDNMLYYEDKKIVFRENFKENYNINKLTDYFSESCRAKCQFNDHIIPFNNYKYNKNEILKHAFYKYGYINNRILNDYFHLRRRFYCSNFKISIVVSLCKIFKPTNMLDFSAGWGDRLIGSIAYGTKYTGVDPSECLQDKYKQIIDTFAKNKSDYRIIQDGFENTDLGDNEYDFIFTSPPFFKYEFYEQNNEKQSIKLFNTLELWRDKFLFPSLDKCVKHLKKNKYLVLYIDDYKGHQFIDNMLAYMKEKKNVKYSGNIYFYNSDTNRKTRKMFVWKII